jgi:hypothetical protein
MTMRELNRRRTQYNQTYIQRKKAKGILWHSFLVRKELVEQVKQFIREQTALLNTPTTPQEKV